MDDLLIDWHQFETIRDGLGAEAVSIFADFVAEAPGQFEALQAAVARDDFDALARLAHRWKGSSATFGLAAFTEQLRGLERATKERRAPETPADELRRLFAASVHLLQARHPELKPQG